MEVKIRGYSSCTVLENGQDAQGFGVLAGPVAFTLLPVDGHPWVTVVDYVVEALTRILSAS